MDPRTIDACSSAKAQSVDIYTVNLIGGNPTLLKACASEGDFRYSAVDTAEQLTKTFQTIATSLKRLRLTN